MTLARSFTATFSGIAAGDVVAFMQAQCAGTLLAVVAHRFLYPAGR